MSQVEVRQRIREQQAQKKEVVLKYRGVAYIVKRTIKNWINIAFHNCKAWRNGLRGGCSESAHAYTQLIFIMPHQSRKVKAAVTKMDPDPVDNGVIFKRCGHCGDKKPQCRKQKKCLKGLL